MARKALQAPEEIVGKLRQAEVRSMAPIGPRNSPCTNIPTGPVETGQVTGPYTFARSELHR